MSEPFTVRLGGSAEQQGFHASVLATLPEHFQILEGSAAADVELMDHPAVLDGLLQVSARAGTAKLAIPALRFAPQLLGVVEPRSGDFSLINLVATTQSGGDAVWRALLLEQLAVLRVLLGARPRVGSIHRAANGYIARLAVEDRPVLISVSAHVSPLKETALAVHAVGPCLRLEASIDNPAIAKPARIHVHDANGTRERAATYQSSCRLVWLAVHAALRGAPPSAGYPLAAFDDDVAEVLAINP
jgi:hypothetical protein